MDERQTGTKEQALAETGERQENAQNRQTLEAATALRSSRVLHQRSRRRRDAGFFLLLLLCGVATILMLARTYPQFAGTGKPLPAQPTQAAQPGASPQAQTATPSLPAPSLSSPTFHEYPLPSSNSQVMRLAMDHQGRLWFGAMSQNLLMMFDPHTHVFQQMTPPQGRSGIMGIQVAVNDTIWFAEQFANYIGHYIPATQTFQIYPLPLLLVPDPNTPGNTLKEPNGPQDLVIDAQGNIWFTEFNAGLIGQLDPRTGRIQHYSLTTAGNAQARTLFPYGLTTDHSGTVWFTEMGGHTIGQLDPQTGQIHLYSLPWPGVSPMEIAADSQGHLWITTFDADLLLELDPRTGHVTRYEASLSSNAGGLYGLVVASNGDIWVTMLAQDALARLDGKTHQFVYYHVPTANSSPLALIDGPHQTFWFSEIQQLGVLTFGGA